MAFLKKAFAEDGSRRSYYVLFTIVFGILSFFCFWWFIISGSSMISDGRGWSQQFRALVYYSEYLKDIFRHLAADHRLIIPEWDFCIGEGSDIVNILHNYVTGDPVAFFSVLVPIKYMHYFFGFSNIVKLYLAGLSFSALCFGTGLKNRYGIMTGAVCYSFCSLALWSTVMYQGYLMPMICFPLMILGMEKIIRRERPYLLMIAAAVLASGNIAFFNTGMVLSVIYALIRLGLLYGKQIRKGIRAFLGIVLSLAAGMCMAGVILLPVFMMFTKERGISASGSFFWLYPRIYYSALPAALISAGTSGYTRNLIMGYMPLVIPAGILLFMKREKDTFLKVLSGVFLAAVLFPVVSKILCGTAEGLPDLWSWAAALLCMYILAAKWEDLISLSGKKRSALFWLCAAYFVVCFLCRYSRNTTSMAAFPFLFLALLAAGEDIVSKTAWRQGLLAGIAAVWAVSSAFWIYAPGAGGFVLSAKKNSNVWKEWNDNEAAAVRSLADEQEYVRMSGRYLTANANIFEDISSTQYSWEAADVAMNDFRSSLEMRESQSGNYLGYDDRTTPSALAAANYYSTRHGDTLGMPYGYTYVGMINGDTTQDQKLEEAKQELGVDELSEEQAAKIISKTKTDYYIYKNEYALPPAYCYDAYFGKETWDLLDPVQKQEAQLLAAYVDAEPEGLERAELTMPDYTIPYEMECIDVEASLGPDRFITTAADAQVVLTLQQEVPGAETCIEFTGLEFAATSEYDLYLGGQSVDPQNLYNATNLDMMKKDMQNAIRKERSYWIADQDVSISIESSAGKKKTLDYVQPDDPLTGVRHDFIVNLGYAGEAVTTITLTFPKAGIYSYDSLKVYEIPMEGFGEKIAGLQENTLQDLAFGTDSVTGSITLDKEKLLCLAVPYSGGWEARVDGDRTKVFRVNERYQGIVVPAGEHTVEFRYHMPFKKAGAALSLLGLAGFIVMTALDKKKKRAHSTEDSDR